MSTQQDSRTDHRIDVEIRRNAGLAALLGAASTGFALAYLSRATSDDGFLDWAIGLILAGIALSQLVTLVDSRTPLLVADETGIRLRLGRQWRGIPWASIEQVVVEPSTSLLRDGRVVIAPRHLNRAMEGFDAGATRQVRLAQMLYGAPLAVPLGWTTRVSTDTLVADLGELAALSGSRTSVTELVGYEAARVAEGPIRAAAPEQTAPTPRIDQQPVRDAIARDRVETGPELDTVPSGGPHLLGTLAQAVSRWGGRGHDVDSEPAPATAAISEPAAAPETVPLGEPEPESAPRVSPAALLRDARPAARIDVDLDAAEMGSLARRLDTADAARSTKLPEHAALMGGDHELWQAGPVGQARPIAVPGQVVEPVVIDDYATEPALDPVIGPQIAAARTRLGMSIDRLSERTQIRPHVLESIEVDDFEPCGGDFYARGHLRSIARVLGLTADELLADFDRLYASAPINARTVFEAELATGVGGGIRTTVGGPRWSLMIAAVLVLAIAWGVARALTGDGGEVADPTPRLNGSAGLASDQAPITSTRANLVPMTVRAARGPSHVVVRDNTGKVVYQGDLAQGSRQRIEGIAPFSVQATDAAAVNVSVDGKALGAVGSVPGAPGSGTFR